MQSAMTGVAGLQCKNTLCKFQQNEHFRFHLFYLAVAFTYFVFLNISFIFFLSIIYLYNYKNHVIFISVVFFRSIFTGEFLLEYTVSLFDLIIIIVFVSISLNENQFTVVVSFWMNSSSFPFSISSDGKLKHLNQKARVFWGINLFILFTVCYSDIDAKHMNYVLNGKIIYKGIRKFGFEWWNVSLTSTVRYKLNISRLCKRQNRKCHFSSDSIQSWSMKLTTISVNDFNYSILNTSKLNEYYLFRN